MKHAFDMYNCIDGYHSESRSAHERDYIQFLARQRRRMVDGGGGRVIVNGTFHFGTGIWGSLEKIRVKG
jgi:hypothetical protein